MAFQLGQLGVLSISEVRRPGPLLLLVVLAAAFLRYETVTLIALGWIGF